MRQDIAKLRIDYTQGSLEIKDVQADPMQQFKKWMDEAIHAKLPEPNAMILATVNEQGQPSARVVLLKGIDEEGFIFYSNYESAKAQQLEQNGQAALVFNWLELQRQVRIEGIVVKQEEEASIAYFQSRPRGSQIGAWASPQSKVIPDREVLEQNVERLEKEFEGYEKLPKPANWGGYVLQPTLIEFWQGRSSRLHDRIVYKKVNGQDWKTERLAP